MKKQLLLSTVLLIATCISAYATTSQIIEAESYNINLAAKTAGGDAVGYIKHQTYVGYKNIDAGNNKSITFDGNETEIEVTIKSVSDGGTIQFVLNDPDPTVGTVIATCDITGAAGVFTSTTFATTITGEKDLYLYFTNSSTTGYLFDVDKFKFTGNVPSYALSTSVSPVASGTISQDIAGTEFDQGTVVTLTALKNLGYEFTEWQDENQITLSTDNPYAVSISEATDIVAVYTAVSTYSLTSSISNGEIILSPEGTDVSGEIMYNENTSLTVIAAPAYGYTFDGWEDGSGLSVSTDNPLTFDIAENTTLVAICSEVINYALPSWTFDNNYVVTDHYYTPTNLAISNNISDVDAWIYPNNETMGSTVGLTANSSSFTTTGVSDKKICRIMYSGATSVTDVTDAAQHAQYYEFQFPTTGFENIGVDFSFTGGQNGSTDELGLAYSIDGGLNWLNGGKYTETTDSWSSFGSFQPSLTSADNQSLVIIRLIGVTNSTSGNNNFNLDYFTVTGDGITTDVTGIISTDNTIKATAQVGNIVIENLNNRSTQIAISTISGQMVYNNNVTADQATIPVPCEGVYIINIFSEELTHSIVKKLVVNF